MSTGAWIRLLVFCSALVCVSSATAVAKQDKLAKPDKPNQKLELQFQDAEGQYDAGHFAEAATQLEHLLPSAPQSFEIHELLGLVYAAKSEDAKALNHFQIAVRLKPDSVIARTNLAANLTHSGKLDLAEAQLRKALALAPQNFDTNHNLADFYLQSNKIADALPLLEQAQKIDPSSYNNSYDLALAFFLTGRSGNARQLIQSLMAQKNTGELHNLLGQIEEKDGRYLQAANEFQTAAQMDPSEDNLFTLGSELLLHRTYEPAVEVFQLASQRYPKSPRLLIGLGMALYSRGKYEESIKSLLHAADLDPTDPRCYLFLSKSYLSSPNQADEVIQRFRRYSELQPNNALAQYYYAISLWKGKRLEETSVDFRTVESLLQKSIALDGKLADAHLQLGILYSDQHELAKSLPEYQRALELDPNLPDAHYRLGQYYVRAGQKDHAQQEFAIYQQLQAQHMAAVDKERAEVQQFVLSEKPGSVTKP
jgi:tetratricopeptide (TPR) repeat protein